MRSTIPTSLQLFRNSSRTAVIQLETHGKQFQKHAFSRHVARPTLISSKELVSTRGNTESARGLEYSARVRSRLVAVHSIFENPEDFTNSPVDRDGCEYSGIFPESPVGLAGMTPVEVSCCGDVFCCHCICKWLATNTTCPECTRTLKSSLVRELSPDFVKVIGSFSIHCEFCQPA